MGVPTLVIARTDADAANLVSPPTARPYDGGFITGERTSEGFTAPMRALSRRSAAMQRMPRQCHVWYGAKPLRRISNWRVVLRRCYPREVSGQTAGPITVRHLQLAEESGRQDHCQLPAAVVGHGLQNTSLLPRRASTACGSSMFDTAHARGEGEALC